ncbi:hypothetical protein AOQ84DRAFT_364209 [Glonium stellatum]|uniref:Uncharacterized protein n=1 Tax=Glonium stellatum TaxID=574774 RepID=A0A8E2JSX7_9PEZI|nr:hypothetical protein AOQ84DRAFT_364209 [Glonium stellatum]
MEAEVSAVRPSFPLLACASSTGTKGTLLAKRHRSCFGPFWWRSAAAGSIFAANSRERGEVRDSTEAPLELELLAAKPATLLSPVQLCGGHRMGNAFNAPSPPFAQRLGKLATTTLLKADVNAFFASCACVPVPDSSKQRPSRITTAGAACAACAVDRCCP